MRWTYLYKNIRTKTTTFYFVELGDNTTTPVVKINTTLDAEYDLINETRNCKLLKTGTTYEVWTLSITSKTFTKKADVTGVINMSLTTTWNFTSDCRFIIGDDTKANIDNNGTVTSEPYIPPTATTKSMLYKLEGDTIFKADSPELLNYTGFGFTPYNLSNGEEVTMLDS